MKGIDLFCTSPSSTAIFVSMDEKSKIQHSSRAIDRHTPLVLDRRRINPPNPCPQPPSKPKPRHQKSRKSLEKQPQLNSPAGSSRYLLSDTAIVDELKPNHDPEPIHAIVPMEVTNSGSIKEDESATINPSSTRSHDQVVVLRVSLHCKGCEIKVKKHLSRMQGVKSFNIDYPAKKVTVIGNVTPVGVLSSISKVKNAQFWPFTSSSSPSSSSSSSLFVINKGK